MDSTTIAGEGKSNVFEIQPRAEIPRSWRSWLIGRPLPTADAEHQTIGKLVGLAVFASDALSSTAYSTQEILIILAAAGAAALSYAFPISLAIVESYGGTLRTENAADGGAVFVLTLPAAGEDHAAPDA